MFTALKRTSESRDKHDPRRGANTEGANEVAWNGSLCKGCDTTRTAFIALNHTTECKQ